MTRLPPDSRTDAKRLPHPVRTWLVAIVLATVAVAALRNSSLERWAQGLVVDRVLDKLGADLDRSIAQREARARSDVPKGPPLPVPTDVPAVTGPQSGINSNAQEAPQAQGTADSRTREGPLSQLGSDELWVFMGDSRFADGLPTPKERAAPDTLHRVEIGDTEVQALFLVGRGRDNIMAYQKLFDRIIELKPTAVIVQPSLIVRNPGFGSMASITAPVGSEAFHRAFVSKRWSSAKLPNPEAHSVFVARQFFTRLRNANIIALIGIDPNSELVAREAPAAFFTERRKILESLLESPEHDYVLVDETYPDELFKDYRHLNARGRDRFRPAIFRAVRAALSARPKTAASL